MKIAATYEKKEDIPNDFQSLYIEKNGKWEFDGIDNLPTTADVDRLKESLRKEREDHKAEKITRTEAEKIAADLQVELDVFKEKGEGGEPIAPTHDEIVAHRKLQKDHEALQVELGVSKKTNETLKTSMSSAEIKAELRKYAKNHIRPDAIENEITTLCGLFEKTESGILTKHDLAANSSLTADQLLAAHVSERSYLAIPSNSGGAGGGTGTKPPASGQAVSAADHITSLIR